MDKGIVLTAFLIGFIIVLMIDFGLSIIHPHGIVGVWFWIAGSCVFGGMVGFINYFSPLKKEEDE